MKLDPLRFEEFKALVEIQTERTELKCAEYLEGATDYLLRQTPVKLKVIAREDRNPFGSTDYIVVADVRLGAGQVDTCLFVFELKAPQCVLMERDDSKRRYRPTKDLIKAENQLIHYVADARESGTLKERYDIRYRDNIRIGGIIIGRDGRFLPGGSSEEQADAEASFRRRKSMIYDPARIEIYTWDRILDFVNPKDNPESTGA